MTTVEGSSQCWRRSRQRGLSCQEAGKMIRSVRALLSIACCGKVSTRITASRDCRHFNPPFKRLLHGAAIGNLEKALTLFFRERATEVDLSFDTRNADVRGRAVLTV